MTERELTLNQLCERANVSVRTVRYYIQQGLLPPAERTGPGATYSTSHLERIQLIRQLKAQHLPLANIRRRIDGLSDEDIRILLEGPAVPEASSAAEYVRSVLGRSTSTHTKAAASSSKRKRTVSNTKPTAHTRSAWERHTITEDIELHIRRPLSRAQDKRVRELIAHAQTLLSEDSP